MNKIVYGKCRACGCRATGVLVQDEQSPQGDVFCQRCEPQAFDAAAARDVERYMAGESL